MFDSLKELAQNGRGVQHAARRAGEFLFCLAARSRAVGAIEKPVHNRLASRGQVLCASQQLFRLTLWTRVLQISLCGLFTLLPCQAQVNILTNRYDSARTAANTSETILNTANVNVNQFGRLYTIPVDGAVYAQPLYVSNLAIPNKGTHNVLYVATMNDKVYAFDAATNAVLWTRDFTNPAAGITAVPVVNIVG